MASNRVRRYLPEMGSAERIAELERRISENVKWFAACADRAGRADTDEINRRGDELAADVQELELLRGANEGVVERRSEA